MNLPEITYSIYETCGGTLSEDDFKASLPVGLAWVKEIIGHNEPLNEEECEAYIRAVVIAIKVDYEYGRSGGIGENVSSISLGRFSASMAGSTVSAYDNDMTQAIRRALSGTHLAYRGIA